MKKLFFYAAVVLAALSFSACSDDDDESTLPFTPENIAGTWMVTHQEGWEIYEGEKDTWSYNYPNEDGYITISFDKNGTFVVTNYDHDDVSETTNGTYSISGNTITLSSNSEFYAMELEIKKLTGSKLVLFISVEEDPEDGSSWEETSFFKRIE